MKITSVKDSRKLKIASTAAAAHRELERIVQIHEEQEAIAKLEPMAESMPEAVIKTKIVVANTGQEIGTPKVSASKVEKLG